jgi:hypothetical protein
MAVGAAAVAAKMKWTFKVWRCCGEDAISGAFNNAGMVKTVFF